MLLFIPLCFLSQLYDLILINWSNELEKRLMPIIRTQLEGTTIKASLSGRSLQPLLLFPNLSISSWFPQSTRVAHKSDHVYPHYGGSPVMLSSRASFTTKKLPADVRDMICGCLTQEEAFHQTRRHHFHQYHGFRYMKEDPM